MNGHPADGTIVDTTWTYVNKDGGPDRRFNNNFQLPVMLYGRVIVSTATGLYWIVQISRYEAAEPVAQVISLGSQYADQVRRNQDRAIKADDAQIAARADQQNRLFLKGDAKGIYGQYPPAPLGDEASPPGAAASPKLQLVHRTGKPRLWREHPEDEQVMIQVDIRPIVPDTRWWSCFAELVAERHIQVKLGAVARGGIATRAADLAAIPATIAALDSLIDGANKRFINVHARDEVEHYVEAQRAAQLAHVADRADLDLESLAELLAAPDPEDPHEVKDRPR